MKKYLKPLLLVVTSLLLSNMAMANELKVLTLTEYVAQLKEKQALEANKTAATPTKTTAEVVTEAQAAVKAIEDNLANTPASTGAVNLQVQFKMPEELLAEAQPVIVAEQEIK